MLKKTTFIDYSYRPQQFPKKEEVSDSGLALSTRDVSSDAKSIKLIEKAHTFKEYTVLAPIPCDFCGKIIPGTSDCTKCSECGYHSHNHCSGWVDRNCPPNSIKIAPPSLPVSRKPTKVFGIPLEQSLQNSCLVKHYLVPLPIQETLTYLEKHGMEMEGIFRMSARQSDVERVKTFYDSGKLFAFESVGEGWHIAAGVLKQFLREMPEPLLTSNLYSSFIALASPTGLSPREDTTKLEKIHELLTQVPQLNRLTMAVLCEFLEKIVNHSDKNKMNLQNIVIIFAPAFLRPPSDAIMSHDSLFADLTKVQNVVSIILKNHQKLFPQPTLAGAKIPRLKYGLTTWENGVYSQQSMNGYSNEV